MVVCQEGVRRFGSRHQAAAQSRAHKDSVDGAGLFVLSTPDYRAIAVMTTWQSTAANTKCPLHLCGERTVQPRVAVSGFSVPPKKHQVVAGHLLKAPSQGFIDVRASCSQFLCLEEPLKAITSLPGVSEGLGKVILYQVSSFLRRWVTVSPKAALQMSCRITQKQQQDRR